MSHQKKEGKQNLIVKHKHRDIDLDLTADEKSILLN